MLLLNWANVWEVDYARRKSLNTLKDLETTIGGECCWQEYLLRVAVRKNVEKKKDVLLVFP
jgi:hypothetical protein